jgi:hypothetical protein
LPRTVSSTLSLSADPAIALANGTRYVVWADGDRLFFGRSDDGDSWSVSPVLINGVPVDGSAPDVVAATDGNVDLVWHTDVEGVTRVRHAVWRMGRWSLPEDLTPDGVTSKRLPSVALLPDGDRLITWLEGDGPGGRQVRAVVGGMEWWSDPEDVSAPATASGAAQPSVTVTAQYYLAVEPLGVEHRNRFVNGGWAAIESVSAAEAQDVAVAAGHDADVFVAWSAPAAASNRDIQLRRRVAGIPPTATPTNVPATDTATVPLPTSRPPRRRHRRYGHRPPRLRRRPRRPWRWRSDGDGQRHLATSHRNASRTPRPDGNAGRADRDPAPTVADSQPYSYPSRHLLVNSLPAVDRHERRAAFTTPRPDRPWQTATGRLHAGRPDGLVGAGVAVARGHMATVGGGGCRRPAWCGRGRVLKHSWRDAGGWHVPSRSPQRSPSLVLDPSGTLRAFIIPSTTTRSLPRAL